MRTKLPKTVEGKIYIIVSSGGAVSLCSSDMTDYGYATIAEHSVTFDVPQEDPTPKFIEALESKAEDIQAEATAAVRSIMDQIKQLQCIEHKPEQSDE